MTADAAGNRGAGSSSGALCALVLGGAPGVRAAVADLLEREYAAHARIVTAEWPARESALAEAGPELDLVVAWADSDMPPKACWRYAGGLTGLGVIIVAPPAEAGAPLVTVRGGVVSIPYGASLAFWRAALQVASRRRARFRTPVQAGVLSAQSRSEDETRRRSFSQ